jgi:Methyltransferase domain
MRSFSHITPRYVVDRLSLALKELRHPDRPWLTDDSIAFMHHWIRAGDRGFEWGAGRSTLWFARHDTELTSIESDAEWHRRVNEGLRAEGLGVRVTCELVPAAEGSGHRPDSYIQAIDRAGNGSLDFCLVDGLPEVRAECSLAALDKLRPGGILVLDNSNWFIPRDSPSRAPRSRGDSDGYASEQWKSFHLAVHDWRCIWTTDGITDTAIWIRPC